MEPMGIIDIVFGEIFNASKIKYIASTQGKL